jgi:arylsulfatase A
MKLHVTEAGYRVPGIVRWPGHARAGTVCTEPVCHVDLLPTVCAIAGAKLPERTLDGADLAPIFAGKQVTRPHPLYWQYDYAISRPWVVALREGPWKLMANAELGQFELYNLLEDIGERKNLAGKDPGRVKRMATIMRRLHDEIQAEGARSGNPAPHRPMR